VKNGDEVLELLTSTPTPDVIFIDLNVPDLNGLDMVTTLQPIFDGKISRSLCSPPAISRLIATKRLNRFFYKAVESGKSIFSR